MDPLDLYAKIEPFIGFDDHYERLYERYCNELHALKIHRILDIGCGNGKLLQKLFQEGFDAQGIERSASMVERALQLGVKASTQELDAFESESFDALIAVADVMNYMDSDALFLFFEHVARVLKKGGFFLGDINTLYGFEAVADGTMVKEQENLFLSIDAIFEKPLLQTTLTLFTGEEGVYTKDQGIIIQHFHPLSFFKKMKTLSFIKSHALYLFSDSQADKTMIILQKSLK